MFIGSDKVTIPKNYVEIFGELNRIKLAISDFSISSSQVLIIDELNNVGEWGLIFEETNQ